MNYNDITIKPICRDINKNDCDDFIKTGKCSHIYSYNHNGVNITGYWHPFNNETINTK